MSDVKRIAALLLVCAMLLSGCGSASRADAAGSGAEETDTVLEGYTCGKSVREQSAYDNGEDASGAGYDISLTFAAAGDAGALAGDYMDELLSEMDAAVAAYLAETETAAETTAAETTAAETAAAETAAETTTVAETETAVETTAAETTEAAVETTAETAAAGSSYVLTTDASTIIDRMRQANYLKSQALGEYWDLSAAAMYGEHVTAPDQHVFACYYSYVFSFVHCNGGSTVYSISDGSSRVETDETDSARASAIAATISTIGISQVTDPAQAVSDAVARVRAAISYSSSAHSYTLEQSLSTGIGVCGQMNEALYIVLNAEDIPTRLVYGTASYGSSAAGYHLWCECYYNGSWHTADAVGGVSGYSEKITY